MCILAVCCMLNCGSIVISPVDLRECIYVAANVYVLSRYMRFGCGHSPCAINREMQHMRSCLPVHISCSTYSDTCIYVLLTHRLHTAQLSACWHVINDIQTSDVMYMTIKWQAICWKLIVSLSFRIWTKYHILRCIVNASLYFLFCMHSVCSHIQWLQNVFRHLDG